jgi:hypothetical protein
MDGSRDVPGKLEISFRGEGSALGCPGITAEEAASGVGAGRCRPQEGNSRFLSGCVGLREIIHCGSACQSTPGSFFR